VASICDALARTPSALQRALLRATGSSSSAHVQRWKQADLYPRFDVPSDPDGANELRVRHKRRLEDASLRCGPA
jgi:hypothetical protein